MVSVVNIDSSTTPTRKFARNQQRRRRGGMGPIDPRQKLVNVGVRSYLAFEFEQGWISRHHGQAMVLVE